MKILIVTTLYPGHEKQSRSEKSYAIHYFAKEWVKQGHEIRILRPWTKYPKALYCLKSFFSSNMFISDGEFILDDVLVSRTSIIKYPKFNYTQRSINNFIKRTSKTIENEFNPEIIVCHMVEPSLFIGSKLKQSMNIPLVLVLHQTDVINLSKKKNRLKRFIRVFKLIDKIGFRSKNIQDEYNRIFDKNALDNKYQFIVNSGIEEDKIINEIDLSHKITRKSRIIFVAANMIPLKNIDTLIKAFLKLNNNELILEIAGDGPEENRLKALIKNTNLKNNVVFLGRLDRNDVLTKMYHSDIFAMVSSPETFGLVYIEAMAKGCLVIGSKGEGIDGIIKHNENGYLSIPKDVEGLSSLLNKITNLSTAEKEVIIKNAINTAKEMTIEKVAKKYLNELKGDSIE